MSDYKRTLPNAFPYLIRLEPNEVRLHVKRLLDYSRSDVPQGSSFAVTVDNWDGTWNLWLSRVSFKFLRFSEEEFLGYHTELEL